MLLAFSFCCTSFAQTQKGKDIDGEAAGDQSGISVSMPDASTVGIGAVNNDGSGANAGHARVYSWNGSSWTQKGQDIDGEAGNNNSGCSVSMPDASTIAVGARLNNGNGARSGHVRVYTWNGTSWIQKGLDIDGEAANDQSGYSVSMPDANTIAIGAPYNGGNGIYSGHVRIYSWNGTSWIQKGLDIDGEAANDQSGYSVNMPDANTVAIGAPYNSYGGVVSGYALYYGHTRVYIWNGTKWIQKGSDIDGVNSGATSDLLSGSSVSMPNDKTISIGAQSSFIGNYSGRTRIYRWNGSNWIPKGAAIDGENAGDFSGISISMPSDMTVAIGAPRNGGGGTDAGHVRIFNWDGVGWVQTGVDIDGETKGDFSGWCISMSDDNNLAIGATTNDGNGSDAGQARVFSVGCLKDEITNEPISALKTIGSTAKFDVSAKSGSAFQWQSTTNDLDWQNILGNNTYSGNATSSLSVNNLKVSNHKQQFRAIVTKGPCKDTSKVVEIIIIDTCINTKSVSVADTLKFAVNLTGVAPPNNRNVMKVYPNPTNSAVVIDNGNFTAMSNYIVKIENSIGQQVFFSKVNQQQFVVDVSTLGGKGIYTLSVLDPVGKLLETKKIVLQ